MDLQRIQQKLGAQVYPTCHEVVSDLGLMLDNACKYNEPDSTIYKVWIGVCGYVNLRGVYEFITCFIIIFAFGYFKLLLA